MCFLVFKPNRYNGMANGDRGWGGGVGWGGGSSFKPDRQTYASCYKALGK